VFHFESLKFSEFGDCSLRIVERVLKADRMGCVVRAKSLSLEEQMSREAVE
jgi:hypothetical protein